MDEQLEKTPEQVYANLCAQIGERQYLVSKLSLEINELTKKLDEVHAKKALGA